MNSSWIFRWIMPLVAVSVFLTVCYYAIPLLELENFWSHYSSACATALLFYWHWVVYIKGPNLGIPFIDDWFRRSGVIRYNTDISPYIKDNALVVYRSKAKNLWGMIAWLGMALVLLYGLGFKKESFFWGLFMACFGIAGAAQFGRNLFDSSPQLVLREDGLATPGLGFVAWESVTIIEMKDPGSGEGNGINLDIYVVNQTGSSQDTLRTDLLNIGSEKLRASISRFAKRKVPFG